MCIQTPVVHAITLAKGDMKPTLRWQKGGNTQLLLRSLLIVGLLNARYPLIPYEMIAFSGKFFIGGNRKGEGEKEGKREKKEKKKGKGKEKEKRKKRGKKKRERGKKREKRRKKEKREKIIGKKGKKQIRKITERSKKKERKN